MKKFVSILLAAAAFAACAPSEKPGGGTEVVSLSVSPTSLSFKEADASTKFVSVTAGGAWTATVTGDWIHAGKLSGTGNSSISVKVDASDEENTRNGSIKVTCGSESATVEVTQEGNGKTPLVPAPAAFDGTKRASTTYQLLVYSFADSDGDGVGDFKGIESKLDYLDELGVTAIWLSPSQKTSSYHGYDVDDYYALNPLFGTEDDFKSMIDAAHARGIDVYMDYVLNHSGKNNPWFKKAVSSASNEYSSYYVLSQNWEADLKSGKLDNFGGLTSYDNMGGWTSITSGSGYTGRLHFVLDSNAKTVTVTETSESVDTPPSSSDWYIYCGSFKGMKKTAEGKYELTIDFDTDWGFLVCSATTWAANTKYGAQSNGLISFGKPFSLYTNANNDKVGNIVFSEGFTTNYFGAFGSYMPDLNYGAYTSCEQSGAFKETVASAKKWIDMGVDGFRLDAVAWVYQAVTVANQRFLDQWYNAVNKAYKDAGHSDDIFVVGEAWYGGHATEKLYYKGLPSNFEFDYGGMLSDALNKGNGSSYASNVIRYISDHKAQRDDAITALFLTNHDQDRWAEWVGKSAAKEKQSAAILLTSGGKPFIYQGEELGYWGNTSPYGDASRRQPMAWDKKLSGLCRYGLDDQHKTENIDKGMVSASISVETQSADENSLLNVYKSWSRLRNTYPALASGEMTSAPGNSGSIAAWYMTSGSEKMLVMHNVAAKEAEVSVSDSMEHPVAVLGSAYVKNGKLLLGPNSSVVFAL